MSKRIGTLLAALVAAAALTGCASTDTSGTTTANASMKAVNSTCCCGKPTDGKSTAMYNGQCIGFCSKQCADMFGKMSDADKAKMCAKVSRTAK
jgi:hypothetical protein